MRDEILHHLGGCIAIVYSYCITHMYTEWGLQYLVCVLSYNIQLTLNNNISNISLHRCWCVNDGETGIRSSLRGVKIVECQLKCCRITRHNGTGIDIPSPVSTDIPLGSVHLTTGVISAVAVQVRV